MAGPNDTSRRGTVLVMVLVYMVVLSMIIGSLLPVTTAVFRAGGAIEDNIRAREYAASGIAIGLTLGRDLGDGAIERTVAIDRGRVRITVRVTPLGLVIEARGECGRAVYTRSEVYR